MHTCAPIGTQKQARGRVDLKNRRLLYSPQPCESGAILFQRPYRLVWPRTPPFHGGDTGSNPVGVAIFLLRNSVHCKILPIFGDPIV